MNDGPTVEIYLEIIHATDRAYLVTNLKGKNVWLPKSQIRTDFEVMPGDGVEITMPEGLARDKGLIQPGEAIQRENTK